MNYYKIKVLVLNLEFGKIEKEYTLTAENVDKALEEVHSKTMVLQTLRIVENGNIL